VKTCWKIWQAQLFEVQMTKVQIEVQMTKGQIEVQMTAIK